MEESTTFEEGFGNNARFPSFTLCPHDNSYSKKLIETFEDVAEEIKNVKTKYKIKYYELKQFEEPRILEEPFNQTLNNDWYFAPKTSGEPPYKTVICLIMAPYREKKHNPERSIIVSYLSCEIVFY